MEYKSGDVFDIGKIGEVYLPGQYFDVIDEGATIKYFDEDDTINENKVLKQIKFGGIAIVSGKLQNIQKLLQVIQSKKKELIPESLKNNYRNNKNSKDKKDKNKINMTERDWLRLYNKIFKRLMVLCQNDDVLVEPKLSFKFLPELFGEKSENVKDSLFSVPVYDIIRLQESLEEKNYLEALDNNYVIAHYDVLAPKSQETINLMKQSLLYCVDNLKTDSLSMLDMGCGSGVLSVLSAMLFKNRKINILATDHLTEAIASTKINVERLESLNLISPGSVKTTSGGDLFNPVGNKKFDIIVFNAPWVVAKAKNKAETALNDENQDTMKRFLAQAPCYLNEQGFVVIGYADHSGDKAINKLESLIEQAGYNIENIFKTKIQTRREIRKWETVYSYILKHNEL